MLLYYLRLTWIRPGGYSEWTEPVFYGSKLRPVKQMNAVERLKVLINSSTPIVVMETVEEVRAVRMVRLACSELNLATFEWTIASGLARSGTMTHDLQFEDALPPGGYTPAHRSDAEQNSKAI